MTLIVNPFASSVTRRSRVVIQQILSADHDLTVVETTKGKHAIRLAHGAARNGAEVVVSLGGDGTVNEVANGLLHKPAALAPLPGGSTNVFARTLGYPNDPVEAAEVLVNALSEQSIIDGGVGIANDRAFLFHVGAGFDAAVVGRVEKRGSLKRYFGHPLFIAATLATWFRGIDRSSSWFSIEAISTSIGSGNLTSHAVDNAQLAVALNCDPYTFLGEWPLNLAPEANLGSPLSIIALESLALHRLGPTIVSSVLNDKGISNGDHRRHIQEVTSAVLRGNRPFPFQLDGEFLGYVDELRLEHRPSALRVVVPPPIAEQPLPHTSQRQSARESTA